MPAETRPKILVVDDLADAADSYALLIRLWGFDVAVSYGGRAALETARAYRPQAVLLDLGMPDMDGFEVARRLREQPESRHAVLIAVTGYTGEAFRRRAREAGFHHFLVKPTDPDGLRQLLVRAARQPAVWPFSTKAEVGSPAHGRLMGNPVLGPSLATRDVLAGRDTALAPGGL